MRVRVLGSAAGGGVPQWNCGCPNCGAARGGDPRVRARTQDSLAVSGDGAHWHLINASPDILRQIEANDFLHPRALRDSPIRSIVLSNGDLDHVLGLFSLRESWPLALCATSSVRRGLEDHNAIFRTLQRFAGQVVWRDLPLYQEIALDPALVLEARPAPGKLPVHLTGVRQPSPEDNVSLWIRDTFTGKRAVYLAATSSVAGLEQALDEVDCVFFDGTFWSSDELSRLGVSSIRAEDMAHLPIGGDGGSLVGLARIRAARKIFTHVNNSNPVLVDGSPEQQAVREAGWEVAFDGMEVNL